MTQVIEIEESEAIKTLGRAGSWRQYPSYSYQAAKRVSSLSRFLSIIDSSETIAVANLRTRVLPLGLGGSGLISHGPILLRSPDVWQHDLDRAIGALARHACETGEEIRIDPDPLWQLHGVRPSYPARAFPDARARL